MHTAGVAVHCSGSSAASVAHRWCGCRGAYQVRNGPLSTWTKSELP